MQPICACFYSDTFPQIIQSLSLSKGKTLSGFAIGLPGQRRVPLLVLYNCNIRNPRHSATHARRRPPKTLTIRLPESTEQCPIHRNVRSYRGQRNVDSIGWNFGATRKNGSTITECKKKKLISSPNYGIHSSPVNFRLVFNP